LQQRNVKDAEDLEDTSNPTGLIFVGIVSEKLLWKLDLKNTHNQIK